MPLALVEAWLAYFAGLDESERREYRCEAAFLRHMVEREEWPPAPPAKEVCAACGRSWFDDTGRCLVCLGSIHV